MMAELVEAYTKFLRSFMRYLVAVSVNSAVVDAHTLSTIDRLIRILVSRLTWSGVRSHGNLQILTKACYSTVAVVPILAGVWPIARSSLNRYNEMAEKSANIVNNTISQINTAISKLSNANESYILSKAASELHMEKLGASLVEIRDNYIFSIHDIHMPSVFAVAFIASLIVIIAHTIYQVFCPEEIKGESFERYVGKRVTSFKNNNTDVEYNEALELLGTKSGIEPTKIDAMISDDRLSTPDLYLAITKGKELESIQIRATLPEPTGFSIVVSNYKSDIIDIA